MFRIVCQLTLVLMSAWPVVAQSSATGSVRGIVTDQQGSVVPGVAISVQSPSAPRPFVATTDSTGTYRLLELPPGEYTLTAELSGFARVVRSPVAIRAGLNIDVDLRMTVGGVDEVVDVRQDTPLLETHNTVQSVNVSGDLLRALPLMERRDWTGALMLAPGVSTTDWAGNERLFNVHGAEQQANVVQIDGADMTPASRSGINFLRLSTEGIDDVQIKTSGLDASSPLGIGGIVNIAMASGTNTLRGTGVYAVQPRAWNGSNSPGGTSSTTDQQQVDLSVGGPVVRNHLWLLGSYRYADLSQGVSRAATELDTLGRLIPGFVPFDGTNTAHLGFIKGTSQLGAHQQLQAFYQRDVNPSTQPSATSQFPTLSAVGGSGVSARWLSFWTPAFTTRLSASYNDKRREARDSARGTPLERVFREMFVSAGRPTGNGLLAVRGSPAATLNFAPNQKVTVAFDATWYRSDATGSHEIQSGLFAQTRAQALEVAYINGGFIVQDVVLRDSGNLDSGTVPFHRQLVDGARLTSYKQTTGDYAFYVQDVWRPLARLTVNAGVRVDRVVTRDKVFGIIAQDSVDVGPRVGVNYALTADGRAIVRAHWVRTHDQPGIVTSTGAPNLGQRLVYDVDLDGTFETTFVIPPSSAASANRSIDPDLHQPSVEDFGVGVRKQLPANITVGVDFIRRRFLDRGALVETNGRYVGSVFTGYLDEAFNEVYLATNNRWDTPVYASLDFSATTRTARVQGIVSYVRQWRHLDGTWQPNDPASFIQPDAYPSDKGIGATAGSASAPLDGNSLSGFQGTIVATGSGQWRDHTVRLGGAWDTVWNFLVSVNYTFQTGAWGGPIISRLPTPDPAFGPPTVTLSNGRVVANPLATTLRFAYATRGDGQTTTPALHAANLRFGRRFTLGRTTLDASLDLFNVTNNDADNAFAFSANQTYSPLFGTTMFKQLPRSAQLVLRAAF